MYGEYLRRLVRSTWQDPLVNRRARRRSKKIQMARTGRESRAQAALRRGAMFWMLREAGATYRSIADAAGVTVERVRQICFAYGLQLHRRSESRGGAEPFLERLRRAGALCESSGRVGRNVVARRFDPREARQKR